MEVQLKYLDKSAADKVLPVLFDILYSNMNEIAPCGKSRDEEFNNWFYKVSPAIQKAPRQIVLMILNSEIIGYFQYYTRETLLTMEEIQIKKNYHGSGIFSQFYSWLMGVLPGNIEVVEAFADIRNSKSKAILSHLGLAPFEEIQNGLLHFRGEYKIIKDRYSK